MHPDEIREAFQRFFEERDHRRMPSAPIVPPGDPTLLFTSAGMVPFKAYFMGQAEPPSPRMVSIQRCFRTTDIESVGDTSHQTLFEMMGNFSVGDYFKAEMIPWAWEFSLDVLKLDPERIWVTIYLDDEEAHDLWRKTGVTEGRIIRYGEDQNYWFAGDVGPCGPDSEMFFDFGEEFGCGPDCEPSHDCLRFLEYWNLVFMTYYRDGDKREPLPQKNIDTGAGLERQAIIQLYNTAGWDKSKVPSAYDTELFQPLIRRIEALSGKRYNVDEETDRVMRIVAEHARAVTFLIGDERTPVVPSNEERGYVCRRLLRRAIYFARRHLGIEQPFMATLAGTTVEMMRTAYPELERQRQFITDIIGPEESRFDQTLSRGLERIEDIIRGSKSKVISGADAFLLHDTYGFPIDLARDIADQHGFTVDEAGFEAEMESQRDRGRATAGGSEAIAADALYTSLAADPTQFTGYQELETASRVVAMVTPGASLSRAEAVEAPNNVEVFLAATPFYPEGGGQVGDRGEIVGPNGRIEVLDTRRVAERLILHRGRVTEGRIVVGDEVTAGVDPQHRANTKRNHTATHLLHAALREVIGPHVRQAGSLVAPERLRFDFTATEAVTPEQLAEVESLVNAKVREDVPVHTRESSFDEAMKEGVLAFFGDKYGDRVRVVEVNSTTPAFSAELCGGTHCERTGEVGLIVVAGESSIGSGMRRIEALSGAGAEQYVRELSREMNEIARTVGAPRHSVLQKIESVVVERETLRKRIEKLERSLATGSGPDDLLANAQQVDGVTVVTQRVDASSIDALRFMADGARKSLSSGVAVLGTVIDEKPMFIALVTKDLNERGLHAGNLLKKVATVAGGNAGGRPDMAQGGGRDVGKLDEALGAVPAAVREMLNGG